MGGGVSQPGMGYPHSGVPLPRPQRWGNPPPGGIGQQMEYLIRGGRYASCVHAGGFSCLELISDLCVIWHEKCEILNTKKTHEINVSLSLKRDGIYVLSAAKKKL